MARVVCLVVLAAIVAASVDAEGSAAPGRAFVPFVAGGRVRLPGESSALAPALYPVYIHIHDSDHLRAQRPNWWKFVFVPDFDHLNRRPSTARLLPAFQLALKSS